MNAEGKEVITFLAAPRKVSGSLVTKLTIARMGRLIAASQDISETSKKVSRDY